MYIVFLTFSKNKSAVGQHLADHKAWLQQGFDDGIFLLAGSIKPARGGAILAKNIALDDLESRLNNDPFVAEDVVTAEVIEVDPSKADERLSFLLN